MIYLGAGSAVVVAAFVLAFVGVAPMFGAPSTSAASPPLFAGPRSYATGTNPGSVVIGDLNSDGEADLAAANLWASTVSVLANRGDGTFRAKRDYRTDRHPTSLAIGDLNGDLAQDLVTANYDYDADVRTVSVLLNKGDGSFWARRDYETGLPPESVAVGDLNGDGVPDVAVALSGSEGAVLVLANTGNGNLQYRGDYPTGEDPAAVAIADLNGDDQSDLVTVGDSWPTGTISVLLNNGDGSFQGRRDYGVYAEPSSVAIGDLNSDEKPDLATTHYGAVKFSGANMVSVLVNAGDGSFLPRRPYAVDIRPESVG